MATVYEGREVASESYYNKEQSVALLNEVYTGAQKGIEALSAMIKRSDINIFTSELEVILETCKDYATEASKELMELGQKLETTGLFEKAAMYGAVNFNALSDPSVSHLAKMTIEGCNMGITDITSAINSNPDCDYRSKSIANDYVESLQKSVNQLKDYL